jgi:AcrR family transcriptional regulator
MAGRAVRSGKINRRSQILSAAEKLMFSHGLSGVTTRQISREVGCSEGALYVHFKGRLELLLAMMEESLPDMVGPLRTLHQSIGKRSPGANLVVALGGIYKFHRRMAPQFAGMFAEPELLTAYRQSLERQNKGPHLSMKALEKYIEAEKNLGRVASQVKPKLAAYLLLSSSFFRAFIEHFLNRSMQPEWSKFVKQLVATVVPPSAIGSRLRERN